MGRPNNSIAVKRTTRKTAKAEEQALRAETKLDEESEPSSSDESQDSNTSKVKNKLNTKKITFHY